MREQTLTKVWHPEVVDGRTLWLAPEVQDFVDRLHNGDPTLGWEGDPRLALYRVGDRWEIWRLERDNEYRLVMRSRPGAKLSSEAIKVLIAHDTRRGYDPATALYEHNRKIYEAADKQFEDRLDDLSDKLDWALKKDGID